MGFRMGIGTKGGRFPKPDRAWAPADPDSQRHCRHGGKARVPPERPQREAQTLPQPFQREKAPHVAAFLLCQSDVAHLFAGQIGSVVSAQARRGVLLVLQRAMKVQLFGKVAFELSAPPAENDSPPGTKPSIRSHRLSIEVWRTGAAKSIQENASFGPLSSNRLSACPTHPSE